MQSNKRTILVRTHSAPALQQTSTTVEHHPLLTSLSYEQTLANTILLMHSVAFAALAITLMLILVLILVSVSTHLTDIYA